jgi:hypothetical protein
MIHPFSDGLRPVSGTCCFDNNWSVPMLAFSYLLRECKGHVSCIRIQVLMFIDIYACFKASKPEASGSIQHTKRLNAHGSSTVSPAGCTAARRRIAQATSSTTRLRTARRILCTTLPAPERPRPPSPCDCPRRCTLAAALAQQPRRSALAGLEHPRAPTVTRPTTPAFLPHLRPHCSCRRPPPPPLSVRPSSPAADRFRDLYSFSAADNTWTALFPVLLMGNSGSAWLAQRSGMGFAATPDGKLYIFGGEDSGGLGNGEGGGCCCGWGLLRATPSCGAHVPHRCRFSRSLAEGTRVGREETCKHVCRSGLCIYGCVCVCVCIEISKCVDKQHG